MKPKCKLEYRVKERNQPAELRGVEMVEYRCMCFLNCDYKIEVYDKPYCLWRKDEEMFR